MNTNHKKDGIAILISKEGFKISDITKNKSDKGISSLRGIMILNVYYHS